MAIDRVKSDGFLAMIDTKISILKTLADSYRAALSAGALPAEIEVAPAIVPRPQAVHTTNSGRTKPRVEAFKRTGLTAAIRTYLAATNTRHTAKQIAAALQEEGLVSSSTNFNKIVSKTLHRLKVGGELRKRKNGWTLARPGTQNLNGPLASHSAMQVKRPPSSTKNGSRNTRTASKARLPIPPTI